MLRASIRDWFCMLVLAFWLRKATPEQMNALGADLIRRGVELKSPTQPGQAPVQVMAYRELDDEFVPQEQGKWGPA